MAATGETDTAMEPGSAALEPRAPQRVMITRMVLDNFKSYAGPISPSAPLTPT